MSASTLDSLAPTRLAPGAPAPPPRAAIDVSIIIVNWNSLKWLRGCLASLPESTAGITAEVIVVDNASIDGSVEAIRREFPAVRVIDNADNRGFAAANNQGLAMARGRYLLLLNPDTVALGDVIASSVRWMDERADVGVMGCQVMESPDSVQRTCFRAPSPLHTLLWLTGLAGLFPRSRFFGRGAYAGWDRTEEREVEVISGMFLLVRRGAWQQVGPMDESYFVYGEEADWCWRLRRAGWRCVFAPVGRILHVDGGNKSTDQASVRMYVQMQKNVLLFQRLNLSRASWLASRALFLTLSPVRWIARAILARLTHDPTARHRAAQCGAALRFHWTGQEPTS